MEKEITPICMSEKQLGNYRYYLCPEGVIDESEIPDKWGLLLYEGVKPQIFNYRK